MAILATLDSFTASGTGSPTTSPSGLVDIGFTVQWIRTSGTGTISIGFDVFLIDGTWVSGLNNVVSSMDGSTNFQEYGAVPTGTGNVLKGIRPNVAMTGSLVGALKVQLVMSDSI